MRLSIFYICYFYILLLHFNGLIKFDNVALQKKWSFPLRIFWVSVTKSIENSGFGHIYRKNPKGKTYFLCSNVGTFNSLGIFLVKFLWHFLAKKNILRILVCYKWRPFRIVHLWKLISLNFQNRFILVILFKDLLGTVTSSALVQNYFVDTIMVSHKDLF